MKIRMSKYFIELPNGELQKIEIPYAFSPHEVEKKFFNRPVFFFLEKSLIQKVQGEKEVVGPRWILVDTHNNKKRFHDAGDYESDLKRISLTIKDVKQKR